MPITIAGQTINGGAILDVIFRRGHGPKCPYPCKGYIEKAKEAEGQFVCSKCGYIFIGRSETSVSQMKLTKLQILKWKAYRDNKYSNIYKRD